MLSGEAKSISALSGLPINSVSVSKASKKVYISTGMRTFIKNSSDLHNKYPLQSSSHHMEGRIIDFDISDSETELDSSKSPFEDCPIKNNSLGSSQSSVISFEI
jgi:hypothetical protein